MYTYVYTYIYLHIYITYRFPDPPELAPPFIQVTDMSFKYENGPSIFAGVNLGVWPSSRIAIVGANGSGKSTLLGLLTGDLSPSGGQVFPRKNLMYPQKGRIHLQKNPIYF